jgi:antitoxin component YwqK of YwqJK toxin-antitoxin module/Tfp pilus assembly protein PilF
MKYVKIVVFLIPFFGISQKNVVVNENPAEIISKGIELYENEKYAEALEEFDKININDTSYANAQYESALAHYQLENYKKAEEILHELLEYKIRFNFKHRVYLLLGNCYDQDKNPDKAIEVYSEGLKMYPYQHNLFFNRGLVYENEKKYELAFADYKSAIQGNMYHANSHLRLGLLAAHEGYYDQAMMSLIMFCYLEPDDSRTAKVASILEKLADGTFEAEKKNVKLFDTDLYEDYNLMFANKNALEDKVKVKQTIQTAYGKQLFFFLKNNKFQEGNMDFWNQHYMRFYDEVKKKNMIDQLSLMPLLNFDNEQIQAIIKKNISKIKSFYEWSKKVFRECSSKQTILFDGKMQEVYMEYYPSHLAAIGHSKLVKGKVVYYGNFEFYHDNGLLQTNAQFDNDGNPTGTWVIHNDFDGNIERKITFTSTQTEKFIEEYYFTGELFQKYRMMNSMIEDTVKRYYRNGTLREIYVYKNNVRNGIYKSYYSNGSKREDLLFKEGDRDGAYVSYHENGQKDEEFTFVKDKPEGAYKSYHANGTVKSEYTYKAGKYDGAFTIYYPDGEVKEKGSYKNGIQNGEATEYWSNGALLNTVSLDESGKQNGLSINYDFDGKKYEELEFVKGSLKSIKYFDKNGKETVLATKKGKTLDYIRVYSNGVVRTSGTYVDDDRDGVWKYFDRYGNLIRRENYVKGLLQDTITTYYSNGQIKTMSLIKDNNYEGLFLEYDIFGDLIREGTFKNDSYDNAWYSYFPDGSMKNKNFYVQDDKQGFQITYDIKGKLSSMEEYDNGRIIAHTYFDTTETIIQQIGEYNGVVELKDATNTYVRFKGDFKNGNGDGDIAWYYTKDKPSVKGQTLNDQRVGKWTYYDLNGKITREIDYVNGEIHGKDVEYYENGKLKREFTYQNGNLEGPFKFYYDNGKIELEGNFLDDERHGRVTYYSRNGMVQMIREYYLGTITSYTYMDASGKEVAPIVLENKEMKFVAYYQNGKKSNEHFRKNGLVEGKYTTYHENGKIAEENNYIHGEEDGLNTEYNEQGQKLSEINFKKGYRHGKCILYHANGKIKEESNYIFGNLHGEKRIYSADGKLVEIITYYDDEIVSIQKK